MYKQQITDVFFDLDHTLWDFEKNSALTFEKLFRNYEIELNITEFLEIYVPNNLAFWKLYREERISKSELRYQRLKTSFDSLGYEVSDALINGLSEAYIDQLTTYNHLLPNTEEILEYLYPSYRLHIITNGFEEVQEKKMSQSNIRKYFREIINSEMAGVKKPNPAIFELALERAGVSPARAMMIGDNFEADILGARAVGLHTIHLNVHDDPDHNQGEMIHQLGEIKSYL